MNDPRSLRSTRRAAQLGAPVALAAVVAAGVAARCGPAEDGDETRERIATEADLAPGVTTRPGGAGAPSAAGAGPDPSADPWLTYGHDSRRTFSSAAGCVPGALRTAWRHVPMPTSQLKQVFHAVARPDAAFLAYSGQWEPKTAEAQCIVRLDPAGKTMWNKLFGRDATFGQWLTLIPSMGAVLANDDGHALWDAEVGGVKTRKGTQECDWWGQTIVEGSRMYVVNEHADDCPPMGLYAFDLDFNNVWAKNLHGGGPAYKGSASDLAQGIALDGGAIFYAPHYEVNDRSKDLRSGVYAFDAASGAQRWFVDARPTSAISAGDGRIYVGEGEGALGTEGVRGAGDALVARSQADGKVVWSRPAKGSGRQAPVLAGGLVIVGADAGVFAFDAVTGAPRWTAPIEGAAAPPMYTVVSNGAFGEYKCWSVESDESTYVPSTTIAAALASGTAVVTGSKALSVLSLTDGREVWKGIPDLAVGRLREPVIVGSRVYVTDTPPPKQLHKAGLLALDAEGMSPGDCPGPGGGPSDGGGGAGGGGTGAAGGDGQGGSAGGGRGEDPEATSGGCGCRLGSGSGGPGAGIVAGLLALLVLAFVAKRACPPSARYPATLLDASVGSGDTLTPLLLRREPGLAAVLPPSRVGWRSPSPSSWLSAAKPKLDLPMTPTIADAAATVRSSKLVFTHLVFHDAPPSVVMRSVPLIFASGRMWWAPGRHGRRRRDRRRRSPSPPMHRRSPRRAGSLSTRRPVASRFARHTRWPGWFLRRREVASWCPTSLCSRSRCRTAAARAAPSVQASAETSATAWPHRLTAC